MSRETSRQGLVVVERHPDGVVELALNRPEALNALSIEMMNAISAAVDRAVVSQPSVVVVSSLCPRAFSVGADLKERSTMSAEDLLGCRPVFASAYRSLLGLAVPVIAAVHGFAVGGGFELALTCDLIVADESAVVALPEVTIGLIPGGGGSQLLRRRTGWGVAAELIFTGRQVQAQEAARMGIVDSVAGPGQERTAALELAGRIASASPSSLRLAKAALAGGWAMPLEQGLELEDRLWRRAAMSADREEGVRAFVDKRKPRWHLATEDTSQS